jgi:hypothetical protein
MADLPAPVVRTLIACEEIRPDDLDPRRLSLLRVVSAIRATAYPALRPQFAVFAVLTGGRGAGELWMEIRQADADAVVYASARRRVAFAADPLVLHGATYNIRNLVFPQPGLYWVQLRYEGDVIADLPVVLK